MKLFCFKIIQLVYNYFVGYIPSHVLRNAYLRLFRCKDLSKEEYAQLKANLAKYTAENFSIEVVAKKYL